VRVLVIRHHEEDDAGLIGEALEKEGAVLTAHLVPDAGELPPVENFSHVVVLGAKWSVYDSAAIGAWIDSELGWLRRADEAQVPILGICFGAQALTAALGGQVEKAPTMEIGWVVVEPTQASGIAEGPWFQLHGDRCLIPPAAKLLASNKVGVQAFAIGPHLGVQFHPEVDAGQLARWMDNGAREEVEAAGVDPDRLLEETAGHEQAARERAAGLVRMFLDLS
jgi:GMP synthase-like glutamine amidotransferase